MIGVQATLMQLSIVEIQLGACRQLRRVVDKIFGFQQLRAAAKMRNSSKPNDAASS
jgi:hypothetical protein